MLSGGEHGKLVLKGLEAENIFAGLDSAQATYRLLTSEDAPLKDITSSISISDFDSKFGEVFNKQLQLIKVYNSLGLIADSEASKFSDALLDLCQSPDAPPRRSEKVIKIPVEATVGSSAADQKPSKPVAPWTRTGDLFEKADSKKKAESSAASFIRFLDY
jgi:hypothetical protein